MVGLITLEDELGNSPGVTKDDVKAVLEWAKKQPHLPNFDEVSETIAVCIAMMIKRRYNSIERAKETFDNFITFMSLVSELYANRNALRPELKWYYSSSYTMMMDTRDSDGNIVLFQYLHEKNPNIYDFNACCKGVLMVLESWFFENGSGGAPAVTMVFDQRNFTLNHLARLTLSTVKKLNYLNKIKTFTPSQMEEFYQFVPKEAVPNEFGGTAGSVEDLHSESMKRLERCKEIFRKMERLKVNESKRAGTQKNENNLFGLEGSFKKLNVD